MSQTQYFECDTPDCIHWKCGECRKETSVTIQEHHCVDYEQRPCRSVIIVVESGLVQNVYGSEDMVGIHLEVLDLDSQEITDLENQNLDCNRYEEVKKHYTEIY